MRSWASETCDLQESPLPDSNRRPLPYHGRTPRTPNTTQHNSPLLTPTNQMPDYWHPVASALTRLDAHRTRLEQPPNYCGICGAEVWPLKGTDVLTCKRGHHQPNYWTTPE